MENRLPRKLAAILYADVAGYSRLTGEREDATHRRLGEYLDLISTTTDRHRGRIMHYAGDAVLAMFEAVVDALSCAVEIQSDLKIRNEDLRDERRLQFRIGVNLGDVIEDRGDIYGDGVNIAARLENLAEPGGICISESVHTAVGRELVLGYESIGKQQVKNIDKPVHAYRVVLDTPEAGTRNGEPPLRALKVLVADDHPLVREALKNVLKALDDQVIIVEAPDCSTALSQAEEHQDLDLILSDLELPGIGGFALLTKLRTRHPAIPVVVLSGHEDRDSVMEGLERGAMGFIPKSSPNEVMLSALRLVLSGGKYLPPQVLASISSSSTAGGTGRGAGLREGKVVRSAADLGLTERQLQVLGGRKNGQDPRIRRSQSFERDQPDTGGHRGRAAGSDGRPARRLRWRALSSYATPALPASSRLNKARTLAGCTGLCSKG
jgi:class 3 adenylate cyclase/DNA-binding NarL/FixJ family response regulator